VEPPKSQLPPQCTPSPGLESGQANDQGLSATSSSWRIKTQQEYIQSLSASELRKKGGLAKLEKQMTNRYFKRTKLSDIIFFHGKVGNTPDEKDQVAWFVHFLYGVLDPDPWKRWTAFQASQHPFLTGRQPNLRRSIPSATLNHSNSGASTGETTLLLPSSQSALEISWVPPWDPSICRRKLHHVKKTREKQQQQQQLLLQQQQQQQQQQQVQHRRSSSGRLGLAITSESDVYDANRMSHGNTKYGSISEDYGYV
jgi:serine/threonine protein kinase